MYYLTRYMQRAAHGPPTGRPMTLKVPAAEVDERTLRHQSESLIIDALSGMIVAPEPPPVDGKAYLDRLRESGTNAVSITLAYHSHGYEQILRAMYEYLNLISARPDQVMHVEVAADLDRALAENRLGIIFGSQTGTIMGRDSTRWTVLHKLGLRICALTYNERNELGDGCMEPENRGLTALGQQAVQEMNRLGIVIDLSHVGERTALDATAYSKKPVVYTHSNAKALTPSRRNLTDEQLKAVAAGGGVIGLSPFAMMSYRDIAVRPTLDDYLNHFDYIVNLIGVDHVGIGTDIMEFWSKLSWESTSKRMYQMPFAFETRMADGFSRVSELPNVIRGLVERGYSDDDIAKLLGGNWRRVFADVWETS